VYVFRRKKNRSKMFAAVGSSLLALSCVKKPRLLSSVLPSHHNCHPHQLLQQYQREQERASTQTGRRTAETNMVPSAAFPISTQDSRACMLLAERHRVGNFAVLILIGARNHGPVSYPAGPELILQCAAVERSLRRRQRGNSVVENKKMQNARSYDSPFITSVSFPSLLYSSSLLHFLSEKH
jgi:hypothetical protein